MRLCFLVLAHYNPEGVARLVRTLTADGDPVIVHVDLKVDQAEFERAVPASDLVTYETDRVDIRWGSSSIMIAQLHLMRTALRIVPDADYYWLVSGDSYLLQPVFAAKGFLAAQHPAEYLNVVPMPRDDLDLPLSRLTNFRFDFDARTSRFRSFWLALNRMSPRPWRRHFRDMLPHGGSSWFALTHEAIQYVVDYLDEHAGFARYLRHTGAPEEWLPHTLLANSPHFAPRVVGALFWADFRRETPPPKPPVLGEHHLPLLAEMLVSPGHDDYANPGPPLVVRKFGVMSGPLVDRVERELWPIEVPVDNHER